MQDLPENKSLSTDELRLEANNWLRLQELYHLLELTPVERQSAVLDEATDDPALPDDGAFPA